MDDVKEHFTPYQGNLKYLCRFHPLPSRCDEQPVCIRGVDARLSAGMEKNMGTSE
jgi:hypothetical protein